MTPPISYDPVPRELIEQLVELKFKKQYSAKIGRRVYVLLQPLDKDLFEIHKWMFGHTDIGWTVKYPHHLARVLYKEGIWKPTDSS